VSGAGIEAASDHRIARQLVTAIFTTFAVLAIVSSVVFPIFEAPDEYSHFGYARLLAQGAALPIQTDPARRLYTQGFSPPLAYVAPALVLAAVDRQRGAGIAVPPRLSQPEMVRLAEAWPGLPPLNPDFAWWGRGTDLNFFAHPTGRPLASPPLLYVNLMRLTSVGCGLLTLFGVLLLCREVLPRSPLSQVAALTVVALNPQFIHISGALNSDNLVTVFATFALWRCAAMLRTPRTTPRDAAWLGLVLALGTLSKPNMLFLLAPSSVIVWLRSGSWRDALRNLAIVGTILAIVAGWFFVRNAWLYGEWDFMGWRTLAVLHPEFRVEEGVRRHFPAYVLGVLLPMVYDSFWGWFGWMTIRMQAWQYAFYKGLGLLSLASLAQLVKGGHELRSSVVLAWSCIVLNLISLVSFNFTIYAFQGRYLFPSIGAMGLLFGVAFHTTFESAGRRIRWGALLGLIIAMIGSIAYTYVHTLRPVYFGG
jgi:hypothetical protein